MPIHLPHKARAKAIIDILNCDIRSARVEHSQKGRNSAKACSVAYAGRNSDYRDADQAAHD